MDITDFFTIKQLDEELTMNTFSLNLEVDISDEEVENIKKRVLRKLRLGGLLDNKDNKDLLDYIPKINDKNFWDEISREYKETDSDYLSEEIDGDIPTISSIHHRATLSLDDEFYASKPELVLKGIEQKIVERLSNLASISDVKKGLYKKDRRIRADKSDDKRVQSSILKAIHYIAISSRMSGGDSVLIHTSTYSKYSHVLNNLDINFLVSEFADRDKIIAFRKPNNNPWLTFMYLPIETFIDPMPFETEEKFKIKYCLYTEPNSENQVALIKLVD